MVTRTLSSPKLWLSLGYALLARYVLNVYASFSQLSSGDG